MCGRTAENDRQIREMSCGTGADHYHKIFDDRLKALSQVPRKKYNYTIRDIGTYMTAVLRFKDNVDEKAFSAYLAENHPYLCVTTFDHLPGVTVHFGNMCTVYRNRLEIVFEVKDVLWTLNNRITFMLNLLRESGQICEEK